MRRTSVIVKITITIFVFIVIPTFITINYLGRQVLAYFVNEMHNQNITNLELIKQNEENYLNSIMQNVVKLSSDPALSKCQGINKYNEVKDSVDNIIALNSITSILCDSIYGNSDIQAMYLYPQDSDYIITTDRGIKQINNYYDTEWMKVYKEFNQSNEKEYFYSRKVAYDAQGKTDNNDSVINVITCFYKLTPITTNLKGVIVVNIYEDALNKSINKFLYNNEGSNLIVNSKGLLISGADKNTIGENIYNKSFFKGIVSNTSDKGYVVDNIKGGQNIYTYIKSSVSNWIYVNSQSLDVQTQKLNKLSGKWVIIIDILLVLGLVITTGVIYVIYRPLRKIIKELSSNEALIKDDLKDEYVIISRAFDTINSEQKIMKEQLMNRRNESNELYLLSLVKGNVEKYIDKKIPEEIQFSYNNYRVAILAIDGNLLDFSSAQKYYFKLSVLKYAEEEFSQYYKSYAVIYDDTSIGIIINFNCETEISEEEVLISKFKAVQSKFRENINMGFSVGIGGKYNSMELIKISTSEAAAALERRMLKGNESIILWNPEIVLMGKFYYPYDTEKRILNELSVNNMESIESQLNNLKKELKDMVELNSYNVLNIYNQLISATLRYLIDSNVNVNEIFSNINHLYTNLSNKTVIEDIHEFMVNVYMNICEYYNRNSMQESYFNKIVCYLKENFRQEINFEEMSKEIQISYSYARKIIKEATNKTILEFLTELRIEEAKHLLMESDLKIVQIAEVIGFSNVQSFNRFFKKYEGLTGNEFRKNSSCYKKEGVLVKN